MIVVDVNVLAYLHIQGDHTHDAEEALLRDPDWAAPRLWRSEFRNILILYVRRQVMTISDARQLAHNALQLMQGREYEIASDRVFDVLAGTALSAYDAEYAALAEELDVPLVSSDRPLLKAIPDWGTSLPDFAAGR